MGFKIILARIYFVWVCKTNLFIQISKFIEYALFDRKYDKHRLSLAQLSVSNSSVKMPLPGPSLQQRFRRHELQSRETDLRRVWIMNDVHVRLLGTRCRRDFRKRPHSHRFWGRQGVATVPETGIRDVVISEGQRGVLFRKDHPRY